MIRRVAGGYHVLLQTAQQNDGTLPPDGVNEMAFSFGGIPGALAAFAAALRRRGGAALAPGLAIADVAMLETAIRAADDNRTYHMRVAPMHGQSCHPK